MYDFKSESFDTVMRRTQLKNEKRLYVSSVNARHPRPTGIAVNTLMNSDQPVKACSIQAHGDVYEGRTGIVHSGITPMPMPIRVHLYLVS